MITEFLSLYHRKYKFQADPWKQSESGLYNHDINAITFSDSWNVGIGFESKIKVNLLDNDYIIVKGY